MVAGSKNDEGGIDILMIEGEAPETTWPLLAAGSGAAAPTEEIVAQGLERAKEVIADVIGFQEEPGAGRREAPTRAAPAYQQDLWDALESFAADKVKAAIVPVKKEREANMSAAKDEAKAPRRHARRGGLRQRGQEFSAAWKALEKKVMRAA